MGPPTGTRSASQIYLLGSTKTDINGSKLPSTKQVLGLFLHYHLDLNKPKREAACLVIQRASEFWRKARIPTRPDHHCQRKLEKLFEEWRLLKKNRMRKTKSQQEKEVRFCSAFGDLFDIAHASALTLIKIPKDRKFLLAQREKGRRGCMTGIDTKLDKQEKRATKRKLDEANRREKHVAIQLATTSAALSSGSESETDNMDDKTVKKPNVDKSPSVK